MKLWRRRITYVTCIILFMGLILWETYEFIVVNRGVGYYRDEPSRLLLVAALAMPVGLAASFLFWLRERKRRKQRLELPSGIRKQE